MIEAAIFFRRLGDVMRRGRRFGELGSRLQMPVEFDANRRHMPIVRIERGLNHRFR